MEDIRLTADVSADTSGRRGEFAPFLADADIFTLSREEAQGGTFMSPISVRA